MKPVKNRPPRHTKPGRRSSPANWALYEALKAEYSALATTSVEYAAACLRAAREAGV
jgi:hypothetical protein